MVLDLVLGLRAAEARRGVIIGSSRGTSAAAP